MSKSSTYREILSFIAGALLLFLLFVVVLSFRSGGGPMQQAAAKARRVELILEMRQALAAASESQNSAVMSTSEVDSKYFADHSKKSMDTLNVKMAELESLLSSKHEMKELEQLERFSHRFRAFQDVGEQLNQLSNQNTNRRAMELATAIALNSSDPFEQSLIQLAGQTNGLELESQALVVRFTCDARISRLRILNMLFPHIVEPLDARMDEIESRVAEENKVIADRLESLVPLLPEDGLPLLLRAKENFEAYKETQAAIIKLSRANTDIRSVSIALNEKRKSMIACQDALSRLEETVKSVPIVTTIPSGRSH